MSVGMWSVAEVCRVPTLIEGPRIEALVFGRTQDVQPMACRVRVSVRVAWRQDTHAVS